MNVESKEMLISRLNDLDREYYDCKMFIDEDVYPNMPVRDKIQIGRITHAKNLNDQDYDDIFQYIRSIIKSRQVIRMMGIIQEKANLESQLKKRLDIIIHH